MQPDDELCICFHVTRRQIEKFLRLEKPRVVTQCSECYGAGTGCGWCVPFLEKLFENCQELDGGLLDLEMTPREYRARRKQYLAVSKTADAAPEEPEEPPTEMEMVSELVDEILPE